MCNEGKKDCPDGSDEKACVNACSDPGIYSQYPELKIVLGFCASNSHLSYHSATQVVRSFNVTESH